MLPCCASTTALICCREKVIGRNKFLTFVFNTCTNIYDYRIILFDYNIFRCYRRAMNTSLKFKRRKSKNTVRLYIFNRYKVIK